MNIPSSFRSRIAEHNRNCWFASLLSLLGSFVAWLFVFALYTGGVLLFETVFTGDASLLRPPFWYYPVGAVLLIVILLLATFVRWRRRFRPVGDRSIIGFHLIPEVLLLPASLTFAIWDHLAARIKLTRAEMEDAWRLLIQIHEMKRADTARLAYIYPDPRQLHHLLLALQLSDWIDLHRGEEDWFYRIRSDQEPLLKNLLLGEGKFD